MLLWKTKFEVTRTATLKTKDLINDSQNIFDDDNNFNLIFEFINMKVDKDEFPTNMEICVNDIKYGKILEAFGCKFSGEIIEKKKFIIL